jgi:GNAT superfamily N-acetyltransferase
LLRDPDLNIHIRRAEKKDAARMMELVRELAFYERAPEQVTVSFEHFIESGFGTAPVWWAFVAEVTNPQGDTFIAGFALYYIRYSTWKGQRLYLEDIIVTESMRGKGLGHQLFEALMEECKTKGFAGMTWQVLEWNEPAIHFYKKFDGVSFDPEWLNGSWIAHS